MALRMATQRWSSSPLVQTMMRSARQQQVRTVAREYTGKAQEAEEISKRSRDVAESSAAGPAPKASPSPGPEMPRPRPPARYRRTITRWEAFKIVAVGYIGTWYIIKED